MVCSLPKWLFLLFFRFRELPGRLEVLLVDGIKATSPLRNIYHLDEFEDLAGCLVAFVLLGNLMIQNLIHVAFSLVDQVDIFRVKLRMLLIVIHIEGLELLDNRLLSEHHQLIKVEHGLDMALFLITQVLHVLSLSQLGHVVAIRILEKRHCFVLP